MSRSSLTPSTAIRLLERAKHRLPQRPVRMRQGCRLTGLSCQSVFFTPVFGLDLSRHATLRLVTPHGSKKMISCDHSAGYMYACNHILALSALGILPPQTQLCSVTSYALRQLIGTTYMPSCRRYAGPVAVSIIMNEG